MLNHSCVRCHQHKIKCSGQIPCANCSKRQVSDECRIITRKARPRKSESGAHPRHSSSSVSASPSGSLLYTGSVSYGSPSNTSQHETLLSLAREALGDQFVCKDLVELVFYWKVQSLMHGTIDLRKVLQDLQKIFERRHSPSVEPDDIIVCMMSVALSLQYLPKKMNPRKLMQRLQSMQGSLSPRLRQKLLFELSSNFIRHQMIQDQHSYAHIQALTMLLVYDQSGDALRDQMYDHAVRASQQIGLHCIESNDGTTLNELKTRTWWFLVARTWFFSLSSSFYTIHPRHFTTRRPVENAYLDLPPKYNVEGTGSKIDLSAKYSPSRFSFTLIKFADMIRNLVDLRLNNPPNFDQVVQDKFEEFHEQLPERYSLVIGDPPRGGDVKDDDITDKFLHIQRSMVGRWVLHQLLFHAYLELYHFEAGKRIPQACISLANHIIDMQGEFYGTCYVLDSLHVQVTSVIKAASVLVVDLMQGDNTSGIVRSLTLWKIRKALNDCGALGLAKDEDFVQVKSMLELEDKLWRQGKSSTTMTSDSSSSSASIQSTPSFDTHKNEGAAASSLVGLSPVSLLPTTNVHGPEMDMLQFLPSDNALYPILQADSNNGEWARLYESFLDLSTIK